ncbi:MAG: HAD family hydrolase [Slackia sp.]
MTQTFNEVSKLATPNPAAAKAVATLKEKGYTMAVTTMPMVPLAAVHARLRWAGLDPDDFIFVTDYATATSVKPHTAYYEEALRRAGVAASDVLMVGKHAKTSGHQDGRGHLSRHHHVIEEEDGLHLA